MNSAVGMPVVICTHSVSYITWFDGRAEDSFACLVELIDRLLGSYPNLRFCDDGRFDRWLRSGSRTNFRAITQAASAPGHSTAHGCSHRNT
jgi:hypothetical protein